MDTGAYFVTQEATEEILLRVTNVCAECYKDIRIGDTIYYDMEHCRYLCEDCQEVLCEKIEEAFGSIEEETGGLFG